MKNYIFFPFLISFFVNCNSSQVYLKNRVLDFKDIFILTLEKDTYGINLGFTGIQYGKYAKGYGLRYGHFGNYKAGGDPVIKKLKNGKEYPEGDFGSSRIGVTCFQHTPIGSIDKRNLNKKIKFCYEIKKYGGSGIYSLENNKAYTNPFFEFSIGFYLGLRIGISFGETFDFFAGIFGYDPLKDDELNSGQYRWEKEKLEESIND